ncbi:MAG: Gfo/Idh/MocA family protein [Elusimicrobiota bacterium]
MNKKIAVIGAGNWGKNHVRNYYEMGCLYGVCDKSKENLKKIQAKYPVKIFTTDYKEILSDKNVDGIVVATPAQEHFNIAKDAISAGKHVLTEKPMTTTVGHAQELTKLSDKNPGIIVMVGHLLLYHPVIRKIKEMITGKVLGNIDYLYSTRVNLGRVRMVENVIWSLGVHDISVFVDLIKSPVEYVDAQGGKFVQKGIEDVAFINLYFKNGIMGHIHTSWLDPLKIRMMTFVGDKKMVVFDDLATTESLKIYNKSVERPSVKKTSNLENIGVRDGDISIPYIEMSEPLKNECNHFIKCIEQKKRPYSDVHQGYKVVKILNACDKAIEKASRIKIKE